MVVFVRKAWLVFWLFWFLSYFFFWLWFWSVLFPSVLFCFGFSLCSFAAQRFLLQ